MAKQVTDRESSTESVAAAADTHTDTIRQAFEDQFGKHIRGKEKMPDMGLALALVARALRATSKSLVEASRIHDAELGEFTRVGSPVWGVTAAHTHAIHLEQVGPAGDGRCYSMRGRDITVYADFAADGTLDHRGVRPTMIVGRVRRRRDPAASAPRR